MALFQPTSGGRFDATYAGGVLQIQLDIAIKSMIAEKGDGTPVDPGIDSNDYVNFEADFARVISQHWENKFQFTRGTSIVRPSFVMTFCAITDGTASTCHYVVNLLGNGATALVSDKTHNFFQNLANQGLYAPRVANFPVTANKPADTTPLVAAAMPKMFPFYVDTYGGSMSSGTEAQLLQLSKQIAAYSAGLKIYATPYGKLTNTSMAEVLRVMTAGGLTNVQRRSSKRIFSASVSKQSGRRNYVKLSLDAPMPSPLLGHSDVYNYPATVVHEVGHMLGLKDEYSCLSQGAANAMVNLNFIEQSEQGAVLGRKMSGATDASANTQLEQAAFVQYCRDAGVAPPAFGQHTASIMSAGNMFFPCHYVTLWAALKHLSGQNDWKIAPHT